jgi:hypothetical protein
MKPIPLNHSNTKWIAQSIASVNLWALLCLSPSFAQEQKIAPTRLPLPIQSETSKGMTFQEFFKSPIGPRGMEFTPKALALQGQVVSLSGFMVKTDLLRQGRFFLAPKALEVNEADDGPANDLPVHTVLVKLDPSQASLVLAHQEGVMRIEGKLDIGREENTLGEVSWIRLLASPLPVNVMATDAPLSIPSEQIPSSHTALPQHAPNLTDPPNFSRPKSI